MDEGQPELLLPAAQFGPHLHAQEGVERRQRLVEQQHLGLGDQGAGERDALLLPARQFSGLALRQRAERHPFEQFLRLALALGLADAFHLEAEGDVVERAQVREQRIALEHHRGAALRRRCLRDVAPAEQDVALGHRLVAGDHAQGRALAATRGAEQAAVAAGRYPEVDRIDRGEGIAIALGQSDQLECGSGGGLGEAHGPNYASAMPALYTIPSWIGYSCSPGLCAAGPAAIRIGACDASWCGRAGRLVVGR
jgi:hypothetical protein